MFIKQGSLDRRDEACVCGDLCLDLWSSMSKEMSCFEVGGCSGLFLLCV